ncbi:MAG: NERD domain-containing protein, partial [Candidatus Thorarchaeota archaeon]
SISLKKGNYIDYIVINKILFIIECINFLTYDIKDLSEVLDYSGFEALIKEILLKNNYISITNFRFSSNSQFKPLPSQKRFEIDVIGIYLKYILIIDAKQWKRKDSFNSLNKAANLQFHRVKVLSKHPEIFSSLILKIRGNFADLKRHLPFTLIPMMVTLEDNSIKLSENQVPLVSIYEFNNFLHELPKNLQYFKTVQVNNVILPKG